LAARIGLLAPTIADEICEHLQKHYHIPRYTSSEDINQLLQLMSADKKNQHKRLRFALLADIGKAQYDVDVSAQDVSAILHSP
jgi:3-dehydroquinate synthetase